MKKSKRIVSLALAGLMLAAAPCASAQENDALQGSGNTRLTVSQLGDVDRDGIISAGDALNALLESVGVKSKETPPTVYKIGEGQYEADVDGNGKVLADDALAILRESVEKTGKLDKSGGIEPHAYRVYSKKETGVLQNLTVITDYGFYSVSPAYSVIGKEYDRSFFEQNTIICFVDPVESTKKVEIDGLYINGENIVVSYSHGGDADTSGVSMNSVVCLEVPNNFVKNAQFCEVRFSGGYIKPSGDSQPGEDIRPSGIFNQQRFELEAKSMEETETKAIVRNREELEKLIFSDPIATQIKGREAEKYFNNFTLSDSFFNDNVLLITVDNGVHGTGCTDKLPIEKIETDGNTAVLTVARRQQNNGEQIPSARFSTVISAIEVPAESIGNCTEFKLV